jgi:hypothetical protein
MFFFLLAIWTQVIDKVQEDVSTFGTGLCWQSRRLLSGRSLCSCFYLCLFACAFVCLFDHFPWVQSEALVSAGAAEADSIVGAEEVVCRHLCLQCHICLLCDVYTSIVRSAWLQFTALWLFQFFSSSFACVFSA